MGSEMCIRDRADSDGQGWKEGRGMRNPALGEMTPTVAVVSKPGCELGSLKGALKDIDGLAPLPLPNSDFNFNEGSRQATEFFGSCPGDSKGQPGGLPWRSSG